MMIRPIETLYRGIWFRSRSEARWAVFFTSLGIAYDYEPQGYVLGPLADSPGFNASDPISEEMAYLPDFLIHSQPRFRKDLWVEVKPGGACLESEYWKMKRLVNGTGIRGTILKSIPDSVDKCGDSFIERACFFPDYGEDNGYSFCQCPFCGEYGFEFDARSARIGCQCKQHSQIANGDKTYNGDSSAILGAYEAARRERF